MFNGISNRGLMSTTGLLQSGMASNRGNSIPNIDSTTPKSGDLSKPTLDSLNSESTKSVEELKSKQIDPRKGVPNLEPKLAEQAYKAGESTPVTDTIPPEVTHGDTDGTKMPSTDISDPKTEEVDTTNSGKLRRKAKELLVSKALERLDTPSPNEESPTVEGVQVRETKTPPVHRNPETPRANRPDPGRSINTPNEISTKGLKMPGPVNRPNISPVKPKIPKMPRR